MNPSQIGWLAFYALWVTIIFFVAQYIARPLFTDVVLEFNLARLNVFGCFVWVFAYTCVHVFKSRSNSLSLKEGLFLNALACGYYLYLTAMVAKPDAVQFQISLANSAAYFFLCLPFSVLGRKEESPEHDAKKVVSDSGNDGAG